MKLVWIVDFDGKKFPHRCKKDAPDAGRQRVISVRSYFAIKWIKMIRQIGFIEKKFLKVTFLSLWVIDVMMAGRFLIDTFQLNIFFYLLNISPYTFSFVLSPKQEVISEDLRSTLNAFLYRTGEQSNKWVISLCLCVCLSVSESVWFVSRLPHVNYTCLNKQILWQ